MSSKIQDTKRKKITVKVGVPSLAKGQWSNEIII
jgi:hypothetical protein